MSYFAQISLTLRLRKRANGKVARLLYIQE